MEEDNNQTQPSEEDVTSEEGTNEVQPSTGGDQPSPDEFAKQKLEETLGRKFKDLPEALKTVENSYKEGSRLAQEAKKSVESQPQVNSQEQAQPQLQNVLDELQEVKFSQKYPDAGGYIEKVKTIARAEGTDWVTAFESSGLKEVFETKKSQQAQSEEVNKNLPEGNNKVAPSSDEYADAIDLANRGDVSSLLKMKTRHLYSEGG